MQDSSTMPIWASMLDLPQEILDILIPQISHNDYPSCILVNLAWSTIFTPYLWEVVRLGDKTMHECFGTREAQNALARNCRHIRVLETTDPAIVYFVAQFSPSTAAKLDSLTIRLKDHPTSPVDVLVSLNNMTVTSAAVAATTTNDNAKGTLQIPRCASSIIRILQKNPDLRYLSLDVGCFRYDDGREAMADLVSVFPTAKLEKLELSFFHSLSFDRDLDDGGNEDIDVKKTIEYYLAKSESFHALKEIIITGGGENNINPNRLVFLFRCPNVETVRLHRLDSNAMKALRALLMAGCPKLVNLEWRKGTHDPEEFILGLLEASRLGWRELRLPDMPEFGMDSWETLMNHVGTLEVLRIESAEHLAPNAMVNLLCSARRLRRLEGIVDRQRTRFTVELAVDAYDAFLDHVEGGVDRSWVLGPSMEHLQLQIQRVPRPDVMYRQSGGELMLQQTGLDPARRVPVQGWIYNQLSRMTGLQELIVGLMDLSEKTMQSCGVDRSMDSVALEEALLGRHPHAFNYLSLEFSLESGLDLLKGLKEMRMLDVRSTAHYIGVAELEWMHVNWPKMERIRGLETNWRWSVNYAEGPTRKAAVEAWMAAHPLGIGSSFYPNPKLN
ncbi:hypothetical protein BKA57DRAFT_477205 [Linnemannia elongata]|nr:hypothetical protein BKA57DRAFT_477205 [Linnemannia elongata]